MKKRQRNQFFSEIVDLPNQTMWLVYLTFFLFVILLWVYTAIPEQEKNATIYLFMMLPWAIGAVVDKIYTRYGNEEWARINVLGKKFTNAYLFGVVSVVAISIVLPQAIIEPLSIVSPGVLSFLFVVVAAPIVEANFFRGAIQPILTQIFESFVVKDNFVAGVLATIVQSFGFAWFHINIFGATGSWVPYFVFGVIATIGVYAFRSIAFEYGLHGVNNAIAFFGMVE